MNYELSISEQQREFVAKESRIFTVTKSIEIDYGHRVPNHRSKCCNVHGHRGKIEVTVQGPLHSSGSDEDMVVDFGDIKVALEQEIVARLDHKFLMSVDDLALKARLDIGDTSNNRNSIGRVHYVEGFGTIQEVPGVPTAENLAFICFTLLSKSLNRDGMCVTSVRFWETPTSVAEFKKEL